MKKQEYGGNHHQFREGSKKILFCKSMVFDHTPLTPPPLKHIYGPLIANFLKHFFLEEMEHITLKMDFY